MATRIIEYSCKDRSMPLIEAPATVAQTPIVATGTSAQSSAFADSTNVVCVQSDEAVYVKFGENPTATTSDYRIQGGGEQFFHVPRATSLKVAVRT
jgi:hypothetical protein